MFPGSQLNARKLIAGQHHCRTPPMLSIKLVRWFCSKSVVFCQCACGVSELVADLATSVRASERLGDVDGGDLLGEKVVAEDVECAGGVEVGIVD